MGMGTDTRAQDGYHGMARAVPRGAIQAKIQDEPEPKEAKL